MDRSVVSQRIQSFLDSAFGFFRQQKETYDGGTRYLRMRVWIVAVLALDVVLTLAFVLLSGGRSLDVVVWYKPGFPANMLVVKNETGSVLQDVRLVLDGRYSHQVDRIDRGLNGFDVHLLFRDTSDATPPDTYRPTSLQLVIDGDDPVILPISASSGGGP